MRTGAPPARGSAEAAGRTRVLAAGAAAVLALTGCGVVGGEEPGADAAPSAPPTALAPLPVVRPSEMRPLVGRWVGPAKDYFQFRADGAGVWVKNGRRLWKGTAIPEGGGRYRFSWKGGDPRTESFWGVTLNAGGRSLVFAATNRTYRKAPVTRGRR
ncbi:MAG TPA: hypothetical protein VIL71_15245 [Spirillospora sp.]